MFNPLSISYFHPKLAYPVDASSFLLSIFLLQSWRNALRCRRKGPMERRKNASLLCERSELLHFSASLFTFPFSTQTQKLQRNCLNLGGGNQRQKVRRTISKLASWKSFTNFQNSSNFSSTLILGHTKGFFSKIFKTDYSYSFQFFSLARSTRCVGSLVRKEDRDDFSQLLFPCLSISLNISSFSSSPLFPLSSASLTISLVIASQNSLFVYVSTHAYTF